MFSSRVSQTSNYKSLLQNLEEKEKKKKWYTFSSSKRYTLSYNLVSRVGSEIKWSLHCKTEFSLKAKARQPARTYIQQLCEETECNPEDLPGMIGRGGERGSGISVLMARHNDDNK